MGKGKKVRWDRKTYAGVGLGVSHGQEGALDDDLNGRIASICSVELHPDSNEITKILRLLEPCQRRNLEVMTRTSSTYQQFGTGGDLHQQAFSEVSMTVNLSSRAEDQVQVLSLADMSPSEGLDTNGRGDCWGFLVSMDGARKGELRFQRQSTWTLAR